MIQKRKNEQPRTKQRTCEFRKKGPFPNQKELDLLLLSACLSGRTELAREALERGANPNSTDPEGKTMLMIVALENFYEIGKLLIAADADVAVKDKNGFTAFAYSNMFSSKDMRRLLEDAA